jgi:hypothetical protein
MELAEEKTASENAMELAEKSTHCRYFLVTAIP